MRVKILHSFGSAIVYMYSLRSKLNVLFISVHMLFHSFERNSLSSLRLARLWSIPCGFISWISFRLIFVLFSRFQFIESYEKVIIYAGKNKSSVGKCSPKHNKNWQLWLSNICFLLIHQKKRQAHLYAGIHDIRAMWTRWAWKQTIHSTACCVFFSWK